MYNENDLKTIWYACKGGMKKYQIAQLMSITEEDTGKMLETARKKFGSIRKAVEPAKIHKAYFRSPKHHHDQKPFVRPAARYDNKSSEERINEYLNMEI